MKKPVSLIVLMAVIRIAVADVQSGRKLYRPLVNQQQESVDQPGMLKPWFGVMLRFFAPSYRQVEPKYSAAPPIIPVPPLCGLACLRIPVQGIAE
jgi:hypothetical protein